MRRRFLVGAIIVWMTAVAPAANAAQTSDAPVADAPTVRERTADVLAFLGGAAIALAVHESGHLLFDGIFDAHPEVHGVHFGAIPFFAISPTRPLTQRQMYTVGAAGIWTHAVLGELIFERHPDLRHERAPLLKGMLAFDVLTSIGYGAVALSEAGPAERDTLSMAKGLGVSERAIGLLVLTPAVLDVYRYYRPDARWAQWVTRALEASSIVLVLK